MILQYKKSIPTIFGFPLWYGKIKNRIAKKHLFGVLKCKAFIKAFSNFKEGDLIQNCSAFNIHIGKFFPCYCKHGNGFVLVDIDIESDTGAGCSLQNCGIDLPKSRENILKYFEESNKYWSSVGDPWNFVKRFEFTTIDPEGKAIIDYKAYDLKYPKK